MEYKNIYSNTSNIKYKPNFNIKEKINEYENENNKIKIKSHYLKKQINKISKYYKKRKNHNFLFTFIFVLIIIIIIIIILIVYKVRYFNFSNYSSKKGKKDVSKSNIADTICLNNN